MKNFLPFIVLFLVACTREESSNVLTHFEISAGDVLTRTTDPDDNQITDYNLYIFNPQGYLEERVYVPARALTLTDGVARHNTVLLKDMPYTILVAANLGYELPFHTLEEALEYRYYLAYPDEYSRGIPLSCYMDGVWAGEDGIIELKLQRLMARIDLNIDRTALDRDVVFKVREVLVGGCPSSALLFATSKVLHTGQLFVNGFLKQGNEVNALNRDETLGISGTVSLYLLENCQGDLLDHIETDSGKVFTEGLLNQVCSYIELRAEYNSARYHTGPGQRLIYRFYLGEDRNNFDVERNCLYRITVKPEGTGLRENSWRVDKSAIVDGPAY